MRGFTKAIARAPHMLSSKTSSAQKTADPEFDELAKRFTELEKCAGRLRRDASMYRESVQNMLVSGKHFGEGFNKLYHSLGSEGDDLATASDQARKTLDTLPGYDAFLQEVRETLTPEIELLESRIVAPLLDLVAVGSAIRKNVTKRNHKLVDFERRTATFEKVKEKDANSSKGGELSLHKTEQEYEVARADYEYFNNALKDELPKFFALATKLIAPLWYSLYWMQLNIFFLFYKAVSKFAEDKYSIDTPLKQIETDYRSSLRNAVQEMEALHITNPPQSSAKVLTQAGRAPSESVATSPRGSTQESVVDSKSLPSTDEKKPGLQTELPPYVVALYDFVAQAEGDLSFASGDQITLISRTDSKEDWWTGKLNGVQGVFPGNYVRDP